MNTRTTLLLLAAVLALGAYIQFGERGRDTMEQRRANARLALRFAPEEVTALRIDTPAGVFTLARSNTAWRITSPSRGPADVNTVMRLLDTLASLRRSEIITAEEQADLGLDAAQYGFAPPRAQVTLELPGRTLTLLVGRDTPGGDQVYLMLEGQRDILVTSRDLIAALPGSLLDLRDRRLFGSQPGRIRRIEIEARDRVFHAIRAEEEQWVIERPAPALGANSEIRQWLDRLYEFRITEFVADSVAAASLYGFEDPFIQVALASDPKSLPHVLKIGRPADVDNSSFYAMIVGQEAVFTVDQATVDWLRHDTADFRDPRVLNLPAAAITHIQMSDGDRTLVLQRTTQLVWEVIAPKRLTADDRKVQQLLGTWTGARAIHAHDPPHPPAFTDIPETGRRTILFARSPRPTPAGNHTNTTSASPDAEILITLIGTNAAGHALVQATPYPAVLEIDGDALGEFSINPMDFRDPLVLAIDSSQVRRITQRSDSRETSIERTNQTFRTTSSRETPDTDAIDQVLNALSRLHASRFIEEDPRDLAPYGLDAPARQLIIGLASGDAINRVLAFGRSENGETFATIQGSDTVFTLPDDRVARLMEPVTQPLAPMPPSTPATEPP